MFTSAGGGYGPADEREPERVRADVADGHLSVDAARADYGVVIDPETGTVDEAATATERAERAERAEREERAARAGVGA
jgi:N-methylhydantoinase B